MTLPFLTLFLFFSLPAAAAEGTTPPAPAARPATAELARLDGLYARRDDRAVLAELRALVDAGVARAPTEYEILWRAARVYFWMGDDPSLGAEERSKLGKLGWDHAERAISASPNRAEGHYWAAVNIGTYALGLGVLKAMSAGLEGKFKQRLERAEQLAPDYNLGGIGVAWGRFYEKLPWPKRDRAKAESNLRRALSQNPNNLRARVFLADTLAHEGRAPEAKRLLDEVAAAPAGRYDAAEERRAKALGVALMATVTTMLQ